jgi:hypothetical protein
VYDAFNTYSAEASSMRRSMFSDPRTMASIGVRSLLWYTPFRRFTFYRYWYNHTPEHLAFFIKCLNQTRDIPGDIFELGCSNGHTAVFLNQHLQAAQVDKNYYCLDTFDGFTPEGCAFEVQQRGKNPRHLGGFRSNRVKWLEDTLLRNYCKRTFCVKADVESYEFDRNIAFSLIDVALYRPTLAALEGSGTSFLPMASPSSATARPAPPSTAPCRPSANSPTAAASTPNSARPPRPPPKNLTTHPDPCSIFS